MADMAGPTRLELATSGVTGRRSNRLNYDPAQGYSIIINPTKGHNAFLGAAAGSLDSHAFQSGNAFFYWRMCAEKLVYFSFVFF